MITRNLWQTERRISNEIWEWLLYTSFCYSPLMIALIVNKTKLVGTTTVASKDCMALLRNLWKKKQQNLRIFPSIDIKDFSEDVPKLFGDIQENCDTTVFPVLFSDSRIGGCKEAQIFKVALLIMCLEVPKYVMYGCNSASFVLAMENWSGRVLLSEVNIFYPQDCHLQRMKVDC